MEVYLTEGPDDVPIKDYESNSPRVTDDQYVDEIGEHNSSVKIGNVIPKHPAVKPAKSLYAEGSTKNIDKYKRDESMRKSLEKYKMPSQDNSISKN